MVLADANGKLQGIPSPTREKALRDILRVGTSAGGARAKAVIAWNPRQRGALRPGRGGPGLRVLAAEVRRREAATSDKELDDPKGYGAIEYAYHLMAEAPPASR
jgi:serine/threonine-protein kinase HipA